MNYLIDTQHLQHCELALSLYNDSYNYSQIDTDKNTLPIYREIKETYQRYKTPNLVQGKNRSTE